MAEGAVAGIDWASELPIAYVLGGDGAVAGRFSFAHDAAAIRTMVRRLHAAGVARVAIERGDGPVAGELLAAGLAVFVVPSRQIKGLRTRYGSAGNKDDRFDAYVLADTLRTDGHRWKPLRPDTEPTRALRALCRARKDLVETRVQVPAQLRRDLDLAFPGAIGPFTKPASGISPQPGLLSHPGPKIKIQYAAQPPLPQATRRHESSGLATLRVPEHP